MASQGHIILLRASVAEWNDWRLKNSRIVPELAGADLSEANLTGAYLFKANLAGANLSGARLEGANLSQASLFRAECVEADFRRASLVKANLSQAELTKADLREADLSESALVRANLSGANLSGAVLAGANLGKASLFRANLNRAAMNQASFFKADLSEADLSEASLSGANLQAATLDRANLSRANITNANLCSALLVRANLSNAVLDNCPVYGMSVSGVDLTGAAQNDLDIMPVEQPVITVDDLELAQLVGLLLHHEKAMAKVNDVSLKMALVLGKFPAERKAVLGAIKTALRSEGYCPAVVDFQIPGARNMTGIIKTLGRMSAFVIADLTDDPSVPRVLDSIVHYMPSIPIQPIVEAGHDGEAESPHYRKFNWVLETFHFIDFEDLVLHLVPMVVAPAQAKAFELRRR